MCFGFLPAFSFHFFPDELSSKKSIKRHKYKHFLPELIKIFPGDISLQRPVFKQKKDLDKKKWEIADLSTSSVCIYEAVSSSSDVRYGTFMESSLFVSSYRISSERRTLPFLRSRWIIPTVPPAPLSTSYAQVYSFRKFQSAKKKKKVLTFFN